jgi:hypothetical protein
MTQVKHVYGNLTENDPSVKDALLNFARAFAFNHNRGRKTRFVFRTTAALAEARKLPLLGAWLDGGTIDGKKLLKRVEAIANDPNRKTSSGKPKAKPEDLAAVDYISENRLEDSFSNSFQWFWGEKTYQELRNEVIEDLRLNSRFAGVNPSDLADKMIGRIVLVSSGDRHSFESRSLSALDLDVLMNDLLLNKQVDSFNVLSRADLLHIACAQRGTNMVVIAGRFGSEEQVTSLLSALGAELALNPDPTLQAHASGDILASEKGRRVLGEVDVDLYIVFGSTVEVKREAAKFRLLSERAVSQASFRGNIQAASFEEWWPWPTDGLASMLERMKICDKVSVRPCSDPLARVLAKIAHIFAIRNDSPDAPEWRAIRAMIGRKFRFILNTDTHDIFTQDNPLP